MRAICFVLPLFLFFHGCISKHSGGMTDGPTRWRPGITSKRDVVEKWGNPDAVGNDVWVWKEARLKGGKVRASYYRIGVTVANANIAMREHRLRFDDKGILVSHQIEKAVEKEAAWSIIPWGD